tara:strand:- start:2679 stop:4850 length:2172 start_codon:yes stop_codon:yes gene_type:complete
MKMNKLFSFVKHNQNQIIKYLLFIFTVSLIVNSFPGQPKFQYEIDFVKGKPWMEQDIVAPFDFSILKTNNQIKKEQDIITTQTLPIFVFDPIVYEEKATFFVNAFEEKWISEKKIKKDDKFTFFNLNKQNYIDNQSNKITLVKFGLQKLENFYSKGIIKLPEIYDSFENFYLKKDIVDKLDNNEDAQNLYIKTSISDCYTINQITNELNVMSNLSDEAYSFILPLLLSSIEHNITYNEFLSKRLLDSRLNELSKYTDLIQKGEVIIRKGEVVNEQNFQKLISYKNAYESQVWNKSTLSIVFFGQILLVSLTLFILFLFIKQFREEVLSQNSKIALILFQILLMVVLASFVIKLIDQTSADLGILYLIPFCILPVILKAFFDTRVALFTHLVTILIIAFIVPNNGFEFVFLQLIAGIVSILTVLKMYKRAQLFMSAGKIILTYILMYTALTMMTTGDVQSVFEGKILLYLIISGFLTLFAYPLVFLFEKMFNLVSDISLLELSDTNNPILKRLSEEAPGTFQHSLQVASLTEAGVMLIGGNTLLARAGAIYHDIGKLDNPLYFIENQTFSSNPHDQLSFSKSAEIIIKHVSDGVRLAKENNLPDELIDFIKTHHGTTAVEYFYQQVVSNSPNQDIDINHFTYPGPKPFSKETAVLMMADSVEAAARSLKKPNKENIDSIVDTIINKQIKQNQFDEADITLKQIKQVKELFKEKLINIHHARIEY